MYKRIDRWVTEANGEEKNKWRRERDKRRRIEEEEEIGVGRRSEWSKLKRKVKFWILGPCHVQTRNSHIM